MQLFARPMEITSTSKDFTVVDQGAAPGAYAITEGGHASFFTVLKEFKTAIEAELTTASPNVYLNSDLKVVVDTDDATGLSGFTFQDEELCILLGFTALANMGAEVYTATYTPTHLWRPQSHSQDQQRFGPEPSEQFAGSKGRTGRLAGVSQVSLNYRAFTFDCEDATNVCEEAAEVSFTIGANTYYPEIARNWDTFIEQARTAFPTDSGNPNLKGFYYLPDDSVYTGAAPTVAIPSTMDSGGIRFNLSSSPDRYVFCGPTVKGARRPLPAIEVGVDLYKVSMEVSTATAPSWNAP